MSYTQCKNESVFERKTVDEWFALLVQEFEKNMPRSRWLRRKFKVKEGSIYWNFLKIEAQRLHLHQETFAAFAEECFLTPPNSILKEPSDGNI